MTRTRARRSRSPPRSASPTSSLSGRGMTSWREEQRDVQQTERLALTDLHGRWEHEDSKLQVLDVRERLNGTPSHPGLCPSALPRHPRVPDGIDPSQPSRSCAGQGNARPSPPACCSASAPSGSSTSCKVASPAGSERLADRPTDSRQRTERCQEASITPGLADAARWIGPRRLVA